MFLHASGLGLPDEGGAVRVRVRSPLPAELELVLEKLRRFAAERGAACD
jgi:hypothetical protein